MRDQIENINLLRDQIEKSVICEGPKWGFSLTKNVKI